MIADKKIVGKTQIELRMREIDSIDYWSITVAGKRVYPSKSETHLDFHEAKTVYDAITRAIFTLAKTEYGYRECEECNIVSTDVKHYRVDFYDEEKQKDYYLTNLCPACVPKRAAEKGTLSIAETTETPVEG